MRSIKFHISITFIHSNGNVLGIRAKRNQQNCYELADSNPTAVGRKLLFSSTMWRRRMKKWEALSVSNKFLLRLSFKSLVNTFSVSYSILTLRSAKLRTFKISPRGSGEKAQLSDSHVKNLFFLPLFFSSAHIFRLILFLEVLHAFCVGGNYANYTLNSRLSSSFSPAVRTTLSGAHSNSLAISHRLCHQIYF